MAETSKNKIYYNDDENSVADVLTDMKKMAESTDEAIEKSKYNDTQTKKDISNIQKEQTTQNTNIEENNSKIVELQTEKAKLETELKEMQEDFYQASVRGQASGEYIHVEDSSNCRSIIGIGGNHEQETREGYNLLDLTSLIGKTETKNGITYKINEDCSITVNGTPTGYTSFILLNMSLKAGTYKFVDGITNNNVFLQTIGDFQHTSQNNTFSLAEDGKATVYLVIRTGAPTLNNVTLYPMIYEGTEDKPYEQYGAMPSPDYRSKVVAVGSNVNLLENTLKSQIINGIDVKVQDNGEIVLNGTATDNFALVIGKINKIKNMTFGGMCDGYGYSKMIAQIQGTDYNVNVVNSNKVALSDLDTEATVRLYIYKGAIIINAIIKPKIVEGTEVGEYSKFGQGCVKVTKCNTNLYDGKNEVGGINNDGSLSSTTDRWRTINYINVKSLKNLIIRVYDIETSGALGRYCLYDDKYNFLSSAQILNTKTDLKVDNASYLKFWFLNEKVASSAQVQVQVEEGTTAKEYNKHEEQSYIMPTQAEMLEGDTFDYDNEEEVYIWKKLILTGNEVFTKGYDKERVSGFYTSIDELKNIDKKRNDTLSDFLCNCLIEKKFYTNNISDEVWGNVNTFAFSTASQHILALNIENISTVDELKAYLKAQYDAGTPVVVYYKLATPTRLAFTDEQKAVAKELNNARTYKNVTNITTDSKAILSLDYAKDLETLLNNTQALAVNNASEGV